MGNFISRLWVWLWAWLWSGAVEEVPSTQVVAAPRVLDSLQLDKQLKCRMFNEEELHEWQNFEPALEWSDAFAFPSPEELRKFAKAAYDEKNAEDLVDWKLVMTARSSILAGLLESFFAQVYLKPKGNQLIVAIKGTTKSNPADLLADFHNVLRNKEGLQVDSVFTFGEELHELIGKFKRKPQVIITGHSLGGFLAQVLTFTLKNCGINAEGQVVALERKDFGLNTYVFDSPAVSEQIKRIAKKDPLDANCFNLPITNFVIKQNWINCNSQMGPHVGIVISLSVKKNLKANFHPFAKHGLDNFKIVNMKGAYRVIHLGSAEQENYDSKQIPLLQFSERERRALQVYHLLDVVWHLIKNKDLLPQFEINKCLVQVGKEKDETKFISKFRFFVQKNLETLENLDKKFPAVFSSVMSDLWKAHFREFRDVDLKLKQEIVDQILNMESGSRICGPKDEREQILLAKILSNTAENFHFVGYVDFMGQDKGRVESWLRKNEGTLMLCNANKEKFVSQTKLKTKIIYLDTVEITGQQTSSEISIKVSDLDNESQMKLRARKLDFRGNEVEAEKIFCNIFDTLSVIDIIDFKSEQEEEKDKFYFEQKVSQYGKVRNLVKEIAESETQTFLISSDAGMGKTTNLKKIARELQDRLPHFWVVRLELRSCSARLYEWQSNITKNRNDSDTKSESEESLCGSSTEMTPISGLDLDHQYNSVDAAVSLVADEIFKENKEPNAELQRKVFNENIKQKEVIFVLDAVDEVCPLHQEAVLELLTQLKETKLKMVVATRPIQEEQVVKALGMESKDILRLEFIDERNNKAKFILGYWKSPGNSMKMKLAINLLNKLRQYLPNDVPGVPLNLKMIAESFPDGNLTEQFKEHKDLYKLLFDRVIEATVETKLGLNKNDAIQHENYEYYKRKYYELLQRVAADILLYGKLKREYSEKEKNDFNRFNFAVIDGDTVRFTHQTYLEYLIAMQLVNFMNNNRVRGNEICFNELLSEIDLKDENCHKIRAFADTILSHTKGFKLIPSAKKLFDESFAVACLKENLLNLFKQCKVDDSFYNRPAGEKQKLPLEFILWSENPKKEFVEHLLKKGARLTDVLEKNHCADVLDAFIQVEMNELIAEKWRHFEPAMRIFEYNPLVTAAKFRNVTAAQFFIAEKGADVNEKSRQFLTMDRFDKIALMAGDQNRFYWTPLSAAIKNNDQELVKIFIKKGARVEFYNFLRGRENCLELLYDNIQSGSMKDVNGKTMLMRAAERGTPDCVRFLLEKGFDPYEKDLRGKTCLHYIAKRSTRSDLAELRQIFFDLFVKSNNISPFEAKKNGHESFSPLLEYIELNAVDGDGNTWLHVAAKSNPDVILIIMEISDSHKFYWKARNNFGQTPLHVAAGQEGSDEFISMLLYTVARTSRFDSSEGHGDRLIALLKDEVDIDGKDNEGMTPLMIAAKKDNSWAVEVLLKNCADPSLVDENDWNCLHHAAANGSDKCVKILQNHIPHTSKTNDGKTAFQLVEENKFKLMADLLLRGDATEEEYSNAKKSLRKAIEKNDADVLKIHVKNGIRIGVEEFVLAASCGHLEQLELFVPLVESVDVKDWMGATALMRAAQKNHVECAKFLLKNGADPNDKDRTGETSLEWAARVNASDCFYLLFEQVDAKNRNLERLLHLTARNGKVKELQFLLEKGAKLDLLDKDDDTCLHLAAKNGNAECLELLLKENRDRIDVNARNFWYETSLHCAAKKGKVAHLRLLLQHRADAAAMDNLGRTALHWAAYYGRVENCEFLLKFIPIDIRVERGTSLMFAANSYDQNAPRGIKFLLEKGADPKPQDKDGRNCLHIAAENGLLENVKVLCECERVPLEVKDKDGRTALQLAESEKRTEVADFLRAKIAEQPLVATHRMRIEASKFMIAAWNGDLDQLKAFLPLVESVDVKDEDDRTALMWAAQKNHVECVKFLIENGANPNEKNVRGKTCLDLAAWGGAAECFEILFDLVAEENKNLNRLLHLTAEKGKLQTLQFLLEKGATLDSVDHEHDTWWH